MMSMKKYLFSMMKETKTCSKLRFDDDRKNHCKLRKNEIRRIIFMFLKKHVNNKNEVNNIPLSEMSSCLDISSSSLFVHVKALENKNILKIKKTRREQASNFYFINIRRGGNQCRLLNIY